MGFIQSHVLRTAPRYKQQNSLTCRRRPQISFPCASASSTSKKPPVSAKRLDPSKAYRDVTVNFLLSLGISPVDAHRLPAKLPKLYREDLPAFAKPTLEYLNSLQLNSAQISRAVRNAPQIFFRSRDEFSSRLQFLRDVARISEVNLPAAIAKCPHMLWMNLKNAEAVITTIVEACSSLSLTTLGEILARVPQSLVTSPKEIQHNIDTIRKAGVIDSESMGRIFAKAPLALVFNAERSLGKRLNYLSRDLGFSPATVGKVLVSTPEILEWSVEKKLVPKITLLQSLVGNSYVAGFVDKVPSILGVNDVLDRILWLRDDVGLSHVQIQSVLREAPAILTYSVVGNLAPKWAFAHETMGASIEDLVAAPREMLCANLQQRAMPRFAFLASTGDREVPVLDVLRGSDTEFCREVAKCETETFRKYVDNDTYLLFFSRLM